MGKVIQIPDRRILSGADSIKKSLSKHIIDCNARLKVLAHNLMFCQTAEEKDRILEDRQVELILLNALKEEYEIAHESLRIETEEDE